MQVFITDRSYIKSSQVLDNIRCNKQIIECNQIYNALTGKSAGWKNHCVTRLWEGCENELMSFATQCHIRRKEGGGSPVAPVVFILEDLEPTWFMTESVLSRMRGHLLAKNLDHYSNFGWREKPESGYYALNKDRQFQLYSSVSL